MRGCSRLVPRINPDGEGTPGGAFQVPGQYDMKVTPATESGLGQGLPGLQISVKQPLRKGTGRPGGQEAGRHFSANIVSSVTQGLPW